MPVNLAEKWGLLPSHNYPYLAHNPKTPDDDWGPSHIEDPEWAAIWRKNRVAYEATLDENGNPPPIYEDFTPSSDFEGWDELEPEIDGLRTPDSTRSIPQPPLPSFVIRTPSPVRTGLPSPPPGDDITFPHPVQLDFPEFEDWDAVFKLTLPRRPITRSTNPTGKYCSLSYKPGKIACLQESDGIRESTYAELVQGLLIGIIVVWSTFADGLPRTPQPSSTISTSVSQLGDSKHSRGGTGRTRKERSSEGRNDVPRIRRRRGSQVAQLPDLVFRKGQRIRRLEVVDVQEVDCAEHDATWAQAFTHDTYKGKGFNTIVCCIRQLDRTGWSMPESALHDPSPLPSSRAPHMDNETFVGTEHAR